MDLVDRYGRKRCCSCGQCLSKTKTHTCPIIADETVRFWAKVEKTDSCWIWHGNVNPNGYGMFWVHNDNRKQYAHRVSYRMKNGSFPPKAFILHKCDNRLCVNPNHLFLGNAYDNIYDTLRKGRFVSGEKSLSAKLTAEQVREMRYRYATEKIGQYKLAKIYGISQPQVNQIVRRKGWRWID